MSLLGSKLSGFQAIVFVLAACVHAVASVMSDSATPWTVACQAPLSMGFSRQEYWSGLPFPSSRYLPDLGIEPGSVMSPELAGGFFTTSTTRKALCSACSTVIRNWCFLGRTTVNSQTSTFSCPANCASSQSCSGAHPTHNTFCSDLLHQYHLFNHGHEPLCCLSEHSQWPPDQPAVPNLFLLLTHPPHCCQNSLMASCTLHPCKAFDVWSPSRRGPQLPLTASPLDTFYAFPTYSYIYIYI